MSIFEALNVLTPSRTKLQIPFDLKQVLSLTALTLKEKNWLRDYDLISVIHKIIGSNIIFQDGLSPICICDIEVETNLHYLLHCFNYFTWKKPLFDNIKSVLDILKQNFSFIIDILLLGDTFPDGYSNTIVLKTNVNYITSIKRIWWFYI